MYRGGGEGGGGRFTSLGIIPKKIPIVFYCFPYQVQKTDKVISKVYSNAGVAFHSQLSKEAGQRG